MEVCARLRVASQGMARRTDAHCPFPSPHKLLMSVPSLWPTLCMAAVMALGVFFAGIATGAVVAVALASPVAYNVHATRHLGYTTQRVGVAYPTQTGHGRKVTPVQLQQGNRRAGLTSSALAPLATPVRAMPSKASGVDPGPVAKAGVCTTHSNPWHNNRGPCGARHQA